MLLTAIGYNQNGEGIATKDGKVYYIRGLIRGEEAKIKLIEEHEKWAKAEIVEITKESPHRVKDLPEGHNYIGGYEILHLDREEQTYFKTQKVLSDFKMNAKTDIELDEIFIGKKQLRYRNKITLHDGGFHKRGTNEVIKMDDFLLTDIKPHSPWDGKIIFRKLDTLIAGEKGQKHFTNDSSMGLKFKVSLGAFYQVNKEVSEVAYKEMLSYLGKDQEVLDLYSGIGTITLHAAKYAKHVTGVEWTKDSHKDALHNSKINNIENVDFVNMDVKKYMRNIDINPDVIIVDPAREGLRRSVCESILRILPERIIYLSCNPATQAADYNRLKEEYDIVHSRIFDMFPQTHHIENLIILDKKNKTN